MCMSEKVPDTFNSRQPQRLALTRFHLHHEKHRRGVSQHLQRVRLRRQPHRMSLLLFDLFGFAVRVGESHTGIAQEIQRRAGMRVQGRFGSGFRAHLQDSHSMVVQEQRINIRRQLERVFPRGDGLCLGRGLLQVEIQNMEICPADVFERAHFSVAPENLIRLEIELDRLPVRTGDSNPGVAQRVDEGIAMVVPRGLTPCLEVNFQDLNGRVIEEHLHTPRSVAATDEAGSERERTAEYGFEPAKLSEFQPSKYCSSHFYLANVRSQPRAQFVLLQSTAVARLAVIPPRCDALHLRETKCFETDLSRPRVPVVA